MNIFAFSMNLVYVVLEHLVYKCDLWYACNCKIHNFLMNQTQTEKNMSKHSSLVSQKFETKKLKRGASLKTTSLSKDKMIIVPSQLI